MFGRIEAGGSVSCYGAGDRFPRVRNERINGTNVGTIENVGEMRSRGVAPSRTVQRA